MKSRLSGYVWRTYGVEPENSEEASAEKQILKRKELEPVSLLQ